MEFEQSTPTPTLMPEKKFSVDEIVSFGWEKMKEHFWFFVGILILTWVVQSFFSGIANVFEKKVFALFVILTLLAWVIQAIVKMGLIRISLNIVDGKQATFNDLFADINLLGNFILGSILYGLIVLGGLILLIVPGIVWAIKYQFFAYLIIDQKMSPLDAIKRSGEITMGHKSDILMLGMVFMLINLAGALCLLIGLFATIPTTMVAITYVYRKLLGEVSQESLMDHENSASLVENEV